MLGRIRVGMCVCVVFWASWFSMNWHGYTMCGGSITLCFPLALSPPLSVSDVDVIVSLSS